MGSHCACPTRVYSDRALHEHRRPSSLALSLILRARVPRAGGRPGCPSPLSGSQGVYSGTCCNGVDSLILRGLRSQGNETPVQLFFSQGGDSCPVRTPLIFSP
jgi:hypothetical protein